MTEARVGRPDCIEGPRDQVSDLSRSLHCGLDDGEFVASQPRHEIGATDATAEAHGHGFQQLIADQMPEGIVDTLELVDIDIEHRQLFIRCDPGQFPFQLLVKQCAVGQIG